MGKKTSAKTLYISFINQYELFRIDRDVSCIAQKVLNKNGTKIYITADMYRALKEYYVEHPTLETLHKFTNLIKDRVMGLPQGQALQNLKSFLAEESEKPQRKRKREDIAEQSEERESEVVQESEELESEERESEERESEERESEVVQESEERESEVVQESEERESEVGPDRLFSMEMQATDFSMHHFNVCVDVNGVKEYVKESQVHLQPPTKEIARIHPTSAKYFVVEGLGLQAVLIFEERYCTLMVFHNEQLVEYNGVNHNQVHKIGNNELKVLFLS